MTVMMPGASHGPFEAMLPCPGECVRCHFGVRRVLNATKLAAFLQGSNPKIENQNF